MSQVLSTTTGTGANLSSEIALGADYTADADRIVVPSYRLSALNGAAATFTLKARHLLADGATKIRDFGPYYRVKPTATDTVDGEMFGEIAMKSGEKLQIRISSSNASDTNVTWERNIYDAQYVADVAGTTMPTNFSALSITSGGVVSSNLVLWKGAAPNDLFGNNVPAFMYGIDTSAKPDIADSIFNALRGDYQAAGTFGEGVLLTNAYDLAKTAAQAGDAMALTAGERTTLAGVVWSSLVAGITTANSIGKRIIDYLTGDIFARLGAPAGASVSADIAAIPAATSAAITSAHGTGAYTDSGGGGMTTDQAQQLQDIHDATT